MTRPVHVSSDLTGARGHRLRLYAHRGANFIHPENTMPAFRRALADGATHLEMDVHRTADGEIVVHHDATGERLAGVAKFVRDCSVAEIRAWDAGARFERRGNLAGEAAPERYEVPLFGEVLDAFPKVTVNVDIKQHDDIAVGDVLRLIEGRGATGRVVINSFSPRVIARVRRFGYPGETGVSVPDLLRLRYYPRFLLNPAMIRGEALQMPVHSEVKSRYLRFLLGSHVHFDRPELLRRAHLAGVRVDFWVVNDPMEARRLLEFGADGIMTDDPASIGPIFLEYARSSGRAVDGGDTEKTS